MNPAPPVTRMRLLINVQRTRKSFQLAVRRVLSLLCPVPPQPMVSIRRAGPQLSGNLVMAAYWGACASVTCARSLRRFVNDRFDRPREARPELAKPLEHGPLTINVDGCANDVGPQ